MLARDFWYYAAFVLDACGDVSAVSNMTNGTLNYHLGDTHNGSTDCQGNNLVDLSDISFLGANYGISVGSGNPLACLDVGPTTDFSVDARPTTDDLVDFEDLLMFAINFGTVSAPQDAQAPAAATANELRLKVPGLPRPGETFDVVLEMSGAGDIQGASFDLDYDAAVVEPAGVKSGELLSRQIAGSTVLSSKPGSVDFALMGTGHGLAGSGEVARVTFRVKAIGDARIELRRVKVRDAANRAVALRSTERIDLGIPARTFLGINFPDPFRSGTTIRYGLHASGVVKLRVFDIQGRLVRQLLGGYQVAGEHLVSWDGRSDGGAFLESGVYLVRLDASGTVMSHRVRLVR